MQCKSLWIKASAKCINVNVVLLLFCALLLVTVLFLFEKAAINNTLISKECLCDFML